MRCCEDFAGSSLVPLWTVAKMTVATRATRSSVQTRLTCAEISFGVAVFPSVTWRTSALEGMDVVFASCPIFARIQQAVVDFMLAQLTTKSWLAVALRSTSVLSLLANSSVQARFVGAITFPFAVPSLEMSRAQAQEGGNQIDAFSAC